MEYSNAPCGLGVVAPSSPHDLGHQVSKRPHHRALILVSEFKARLHGQMGAHMFFTLQPSFARLESENKIDGDAKTEKHSVSPINTSNQHISGVPS